MRKILQIVTFNVVGYARPWKELWKQLFSGTQHHQNDREHSSYLL